MKIKILKIIQSIAPIFLTLIAIWGSAYLLLSETEFFKYWPLWIKCGIGMTIFYFWILLWFGVIVIKNKIKNDESKKSTKQEKVKPWPLPEHIEPSKPWPRK